MASKEDWLKEGCAVLTESGAQALTIDLLCQRLGLTKGSFYHHFKGFSGFKTELLSYFEQEGTLNIIEITEQAPQNKLQQLLEASVSYPPGLEVAIRAWALQDDEVQAVQQRVDQQRVDYVQKLYMELGESPERALHLAQILYTVLIGCQQIQPHIDEAGMTALFNEFQRLYTRAKS